METNQVRIRVSPDDWDTLSDLAGGVLTRQSVAAMLLSAACDAVRQNGGKIGLPPFLSVGVHEKGAADTNRILKMNEPAKSKAQK